MVSCLSHYGLPYSIRFPIEGYPPSPAFAKILLC